MKKAISGSLLTVLALTALAPSFVSAAGQAGVTPTAPQSNTTAAKVTFTADNNSQGPVDPEQPGSNDSGNSNESTGNQGPLSLDSIPTAFDFGSHAIAATEALLDLDKVGTPAVIPSTYVQITDKRGADASGWTLNAALTDLKKDSTTPTGVALKFTGGYVQKAATATDGTAQYILSDAAIGAGEAVVGEAGIPVATAAAHKGTGLNHVMWNPNAKATDFLPGNTTDRKAPGSVQLKVPEGSVAAGTYTGTVTWTLSTTAIA